MKKRFILFVFITLMALSSIVYAASPRLARVIPGISFDGTTATCTVYISADKPNDEIEAVIRLWNGSQCKKTWERSAVGELSFSEEARVTRGLTYELTVDVTIDGRTLSQFSIEKTCP